MNIVNTGVDMPEARLVPSHCGLLPLLRAAAEVPLPGAGASLKQRNSNLFTFSNTQVSSKMLQHRAEKR